MPILTTLPERRLRVTVYGDSGVGKTYFATSAALVKELCPVLIFDVERRADQIVFQLGDRKVPLWSLVERGRAQIYRVESANELDHVAETIKHPGKWRTIVLDGFTELYSLVMDDWLASKGRGSTQPQQADYSHCHGEVMTVLKAIRDTPANFVGTAGKQYREDQTQGILFIEPDIVGKMSNRLPRFMDIVGLMSSELRAARPAVATANDVQRYMQVQPYGRAVAKDCSSNLGAIIANPLMPSVYRTYFGLYAGGGTEPPDAPATATPAPSLGVGVTEIGESNEQPTT